MTDTERLDGWLKRENLKGFLAAISEVVGYRFGDLDWGALEAGLGGESDATGWFTYPLVGDTTIEVAVSRTEEEGDCDIRITIPDGDPCLKGKISVVWMIFNKFQISPNVELLD